MRTLVIGCNHRSAPVELRERIAFDAAQIDRALQQLSLRFPCCEAVLISTCNRMELYLARPVHGQPRLEQAIEFIADFHDVPVDQIAASFYHHEDIEAVRHLFRMVSSLDSMVLGESQILSQAKEAFERARAAGTTGKRLEALFQRALSVAKQTRTKTAIATGRLSVASTAVDLARQIFSRFDDKTVLMVGAGEMGELTLTHLIETRPRAILVTNRTDARATEIAARLAERHGIPTAPVPYAQWIDRLVDVDIVITSTGSREPILTADRFRPVYDRRRFRPLLLIDIAVPRDIEAALERYDGLYLYNIDHLQSVVELNLAQRREAIGRCHAIIEDNVIEFIESQSRGDIGPVVTALQSRFQQIGRQELERILPKLGSLSEHDHALIEEMLHRITQKLLHGPLSLLNDKSLNGAAQVYADTLRAMFQLPESSSESSSKTGKSSLPGGEGH